MEFLLGCNYWASNAGTEMWREWNEDAVRADFEILYANGVRCLRVFPNWRDFQPVCPLYDIVGRIREYRQNEHDLPQNPYYLDETMLGRFERFCDIAEEYGMKLIVGLLTGWMSGRLFIPPALYGKNLYTDSTALVFEQKFIEGFLKRLKHESAIFAWNLGNECNCMSEAENREAAQGWTMLISNAIRANDQTRPVISGMHTLSVEGKWRIADQAASTDILTTHPYPYFVEHCSLDKIASMRTLLHASCETKYYSELGGKPCLVEELGTLGPSVCSDKTAADFMRVNLFSNWANGAAGVLWWCANEQIMLETPPYCWNMCETELGMIDKYRKPKPVLLEMKKFGEWLSQLDFELPKAKIDAVCIVTEGQDQWGTAYMTFMLAKQAKLNIEFAYSGGDIPESDIYILPSVNSIHIMPSYKMRELKKRVFEGATLYISNDDSIISEFSELVGAEISDSQTKPERGTFEIDGEALFYSRNRVFSLTSGRATVLCCDENSNPLITKAQFGKGTVFYVNFPVETCLLNESEAYSSNQYMIYKSIFSKKISEHIVNSNSPSLGITEHFCGGKVYAVIINYSENEVEMNLEINSEYSLQRVIRGNAEKIKPFDAAVLEFEQCEKSVGSGA